MGYEPAWSVSDGPGINGLQEVLNGVTAWTVEAVAVAAATPEGFLGAITENEVETEAEDGVMASVEMEWRLKLFSLNEGDDCENEVLPVQPGVNAGSWNGPRGLMGEM